MNLYTHRWGRGDTRALLIHGIGSSGATWWQIAEGLTGMAVSAPDLRGHGLSPRAETYTAAAYASDLGAGWDLVIGHSLGGLIAAHAAQDPGFARRLILLDPVLEIDDFDAVTAANAAEVAHPPAPAEIAAANPGWHPRHAPLKALAAGQADAHAVERTMYDNAPWRHRGLADGLTVPTLILGGDPAVFTMCAPDLGAANPNVAYRMVEGTGHSVHRDRPDVVLGSV